MKLPPSTDLKKALTAKTVVVAILIIVGFGAAGYFYYNNLRTQDELSKLKTDPQALAQKETEDLLKKVGKLVELPINETPTIATVTDKEKLQDQPFFSTAENGDKVLIFTEAKKAILYRPSINKIIEIAPVRIGEDQPKTKKKTETPTNP